MNIHAISQISLINTHFCRPLSSDAGRCRTSKCRSNRTKLNFDDSDAATTHDGCRTLCEQRRLNNVFNYSVVVRCRPSTDDNGRRRTVCERAFMSSARQIFRPLRQETPCLSMQMTLMLSFLPASPRLALQN